MPTKDGTKVTYLSNEDESLVLCPECGCTSDYCVSIHHSACEDCGDLLNIGCDKDGNDTWECWNEDCAAVKEAQ